MNGSTEKMELRREYKKVNSQTLENRKSKFKMLVAFVSAHL